MRSPRSWRRESDSVPGPTAAQYFMAVLGWKPSSRPFYTTAKRECGSCHQIQPGTEFDVPPYNTCKGCTR